MTDFKIAYDDRIYTMFLDSSNVTPDTIEVKVIMYGTVYPIFKDKKTNTWNNHIGKFELTKGLLQAVGSTLEEHLKI